MVRPSPSPNIEADELTPIKVLQNTNSGGVTVNDVMMHYGVPGAPFGGIGDSGMGYYHGKYGFMAFTHQRTVLEIPAWLDKLLAMRYPPYDMGNRSKVAVKNRLGFRRGETMEDQTIDGQSSLRWIKIGILGALVAAPVAERFFGIPVGAVVKSWI